MRISQLFLCLVFGVVPAPVLAQVTWSGDFRGNNFFQYRYVQCGAFEGSGPCPYGDQATNVDTTTGTVNCPSPGVNGCRMQLVSPPSNASSFSTYYRPAGNALKVVVAHNPNDSTDPHAGDNGPAIGKPWADQLRNEFAHARGWGTGDSVYHDEGDVTYYGWSTFIPTSSELPQPPGNNAADFHTLLQLKGGACSSPNLQLILQRNPSDTTKWRLALHSINSYPNTTSIPL